MKAGVTLIDQVRHRHRWRRTAGASELAQLMPRFSGVFVAGTGPAFSVLPAATAAGVPSAVYVDVTMERHAQHNEWSRNWLFRREVDHERRCLRAADRVLCVSDWARQSLHDDLGIDPAVTSTVPPVYCRSEAPDVRTRPTDDGPVRLVSVGAPWIRKGMDLTHGWMQRRPDLAVELHLFGDAPPGVTDSRVVVHGPVGGDELIRKWLPQFDLLVHPSRRDQSSNVVVEAAWAGVPAVATRLGGIPELIDPGTTGWLLSDGTTEAVDRTLDAIVADQAALASAGRAARARAEREWDADREFAPFASWLAGRAAPPSTDERGRPTAP